MHANHEQNLWIVGGRDDNGETIARSAFGVSAHRGASFSQSVGERESTIHFGASSLPCRLRHPGENLAHAGLIAAANEFEIGTGHA